ncbi:phenylacetate--CoA ligase family protein [Desulfatiglans anilini]|uniref:phenylacetate--CoA ligase family protein n=1 Tax=Desulfatiglans anilini TaxID=90728 RepID=UPI0003FE4642|nr:AMP-binding protein [Desulfatiglans anilini]
MGDYWNQRFEAMPWADVHKYWLQKFNLLLDYVKSNSPFYRKHLAETTAVASFDDLTAVPVMTKSEIREAQLAGDAENPLGTIQVARTEDIVQVISSSGTTGRPVYYGITRKDLESWRESLAAFTYTANIRKSDVAAHVVGTPIFAGGEPYFEGMRHIGATVVWAGGLATERLFETLRNLHCTAILGTTSFDLYLAENCRKYLGVDARDLGIRKILGGGEPGLGEAPIRDRIKELWGAESVREIMGLADIMPGMWAECEEEKGMHFTAQPHVMVELTEPGTGKHLPWEPGVCGEPVYTTITREATPIIRYASHDFIRVEAVDCSCGRTSPRMRCIGRVDDMLIYKAMNVFPSAIRDVVVTSFKDALTGYLQVVKDSAAQVRFDKPIPVDIEVLPSVEDKVRLKKDIENKVREILVVKIEANLVPPETIPRTVYKTPLVRVR